MSRQLIYRQVSEAHSLPLFFQPWWLDITALHWDAAIAEDKGILAVWPYTVEKKAGIAIIRNPLLTPYLGPCFFLPEYEREMKRLNKEDKIYNSFWEQLPDWDFFEVQCLPGYNNFLPFHHKGFTHTQRITYRIDLKAAETEIFGSMDASKRTHIRNAEQDLKIADGISGIHDFYKAHKETLVRKGEAYPYSAAYFEKLIKTCMERNAGTLNVAINTNGDTSAWVFTAHDAETMYLLLSAANKSAMHNGAVSLLIWEAIKHAKSLGLKVFDFEGSMDTGIEMFFRSFGGKRVSYLSCTSNKSKLWRLKRALLG